jgi:hypothetical protein
MRECDKAGGGKTQASAVPNFDRSGRVFSYWVVPSEWAIGFIVFIGFIGFLVFFLLNSTNPRNYGTP